MQKKKCIECGEPFEGRIDKKFCNHHCRIAYNNSLRAQYNKAIRKIDIILHHNFEILRRFINSKQTKISKSMLSEAGFNFTYFTNMYVTQKGNIYYFCYEFGYRYVGEKDQVLIVPKGDYI